MPNTRNKPQFIIIILTVIFSRNEVFNLSILPKNRYWIQQFSGVEDILFPSQLMYEEMEMYA
jgi:hypothetical protein